MSDRDDAPPAEAVEALLAFHHAATREVLKEYGIPANPALSVPLEETPQWYREAAAIALGGMLMGARTLPAAARWRLIGWLADGLEPTREMLIKGGLHTYGTHEVGSIVTAALAAAREAGDAE